MTATAERIYDEDKIKNIVYSDAFGSDELPFLQCIL